MKYKESLVPRTQKDLHGYISNVMLSAPTHRFLEFEDFDGAFFALERGVDNLAGRFGDVKSKQLLDMLRQAKTHYESGDNRLGGALLEDMRKVVMGRKPWAYPAELYRWTV